MLFSNTTSSAPQNSVHDMLIQLAASTAYSETVLSFPPQWVYMTIDVLVHNTVLLVLLNKDIKDQMHNSANETHLFNH